MQPFDRGLRDRRATEHHRRRGKARRESDHRRLPLNYRRTSADVFEFERSYLEF